MKVDFVTLDVFTSRPFAGNQLLVVPDARGLSTEQMQAIAREINFSESTFVLPPDDSRHAYRQRTFVPVKEIPYAGHPTVGTAFALDLLGKLPAGVSRITIEVGFGPLDLELIRDGGRLARVRMAQGSPAWDEPVSDPVFLARLEAGLSLAKGSLGGALPVQAVSTGNRFLIVPVPDVAALAASAPDPRSSPRARGRARRRSGRSSSRRTRDGSARVATSPAPGFPRTRPPARRQGRSASTSRSTAPCPEAWRRGAAASRSTRESRWAGRRRSR